MAVSRQLVLAIAGQFLLSAHMILARLPGDTDVAPVSLTRDAPPKRPTIRDTRQGRYQHVRGSARQYDGDPVDLSGLESATVSMLVEVLRWLLAGPRRSECWCGCSGLPVEVPETGCRGPAELQGRSPGPAGGAAEDPATGRRDSGASWP